MSKPDKGFIIDALKDKAIILSEYYTGNIQITLDVNRANRIAKIKITENIQ